MSSIMVCEQAACKDAEVLPHLLATVQHSQSPEVQLLAAQTPAQAHPRATGAASAARSATSQHDLAPPHTAACQSCHVTHGLYRGHHQMAG